MTAIISSLHKFENRFDSAVHRFSFRHPYLFMAAMCIGAPMFILGSVIVCTTIVSLPVAWIMDWF